MKASERHQVARLRSTTDMFEMRTAGLSAGFDGLPYQDAELGEGFVAPYCQVLPFDQRGVWYIYNEVNCELSFPLRANTNTTHLFLTVSDIFTRHGFPMVPAGIEGHTGRKSEFWMHPSYGETTLRLGIFWWMFSDGNRNDYFSQFWERFRKEGTEMRVPWGKYLPAASLRGLSETNGRMRSSFNKLDEFRKLLDLNGPNGMFRTDYWVETLEL
jgi:hypothetical protein